MKLSSLVRTTLLAGVCVGIVTGCAWLDDWPPGDSDNTAQVAPKPGEAKIVRASEASWAPPQARDLSAPPKGLAIDADAAERIAMLEQQVETLRSELDMMMPALTKLVEVQGGLQKALAQVEPAAGDPAPSRVTPMPLTQPVAAGGPEPGTVAWYEEQERMARRQTPPSSATQPQAFQPAPAPQAQAGSYDQAYRAAPVAAPSVPPPPAQYQQASYQAPQPAPAAQPVSAPAAAGGAAVYNVRFGEHDDKTRMVLDTSSEVAFRYDVDNNEHILMVELPGTGWQGTPQMQVADSPLVAAYNVVPDNQGGSQLIMQLKQPVQVVWAQALPPGGPQGNRVVFDLAPI